MKYLLIFLLLVGCSTVTPVESKFPAAVPELMERCPDLKQTPQTDKLSVVVDVVVDNYATYHECQAKVDGWNEWYKKQKEIFESK